jgi:hypothetical protein
MGSLPFPRKKDKKAKKEYKKREGKRREDEKN